ncbi:hypothetical protein DRP77_00415 [Candidatus Poribacteria bacterium]|nr:MAG: hypothetical protein DRP77_00415 [Candidatus Poribacteria bacterium]
MRRYSHSDIVYHLLDEERKSRYFRDFLTELEFNFGGGWGRADLVIIESGRQVKRKRGKTLALYEVKLEEKGIAGILFNACQQVALYKIGLLNPSLFVADKEKASLLEGALGFTAEIVIPEKLFAEWDMYTKDVQDRIAWLMRYYGIGLRVFDDKLRFTQKLFAPMMEELV